MKVSFIVPVHNSDKFLKKCLESILAQTYKNFEIICIDDCSTDDSLKILHEFQKSFPEMIKVSSNKSNLGAGQSRGKGVALAKGDFIMFIDSDDYIAEDYLETYVAAHNRDRTADIIVGGYIRDSGRKLTKHYVSDSVWSITTYTIPVAKLIRKNFIIENGIQLKSFYCGEDIYFSLAMFCSNPKYKVIQYAGYYYYKNNQSTTQTMTPSKKQELYISEIFDALSQDYDFSSLQKQVYEVIEYTYYANMVNALVTFGHGCGIATMRKKYSYFYNDIQKRFPNYERNSLFSLKRPTGQTLKIHSGVASAYFLRKIHLDKLMFYLISLI